MQQPLSSRAIVPPCGSNSTSTPAVSGFLSGLCVCLALMAVPFYAHGQSVKEADVIAALDVAWDRAAGPPDFGDNKVLWRTELVYVPPMEEVKALRSAVAGHPDHPRKNDLAAYEQRLRGNPTVLNRYLVLRSDSEWRWGEDTDGRFLDVVVTDKSRWEMSPKVMRIYPNSGTADDGRDPAVDYNVFWSELGRLLTGGFSLAVRSGLELEDPSVAPDGSWTVIASKPSSEEGKQFRVRFDGTFDVVTQQVLPSSMEIVTHELSPVSVGRKELYADWVWQDDLQRWIAGTALVNRPDGQPDRRFVFEGVEPTGSTFDKVVRKPGPDEEDAIRGRSTYTSIVDFRSNEVMDTASGTKAEFVMQSAKQKNKDTFQWIGWSAAAAIVAALVYLRLRRGS